MLIQKIAENDKADTQLNPQRHTQGELVIVEVYNSHSLASMVKPVDGQTDQNIKKSLCNKEASVQGTLHLSWILIKFTSNLVAMYKLTLYLCQISK